MMIRCLWLVQSMPKDFPDKYRAAIINTMELWAVKKHLQKPPTFESMTS